MRNEIIQHLEDLLEENNKQGAYITLFKGKRLKLRSGKGVWVSLAAAKNAIRNEVPTFYVVKDANRTAEADWKQKLRIIKELENEGIIQYEKL
jgi:hypothetical protein